METKKKFRRIWIRGHYRKIKMDGKVVRKWCEGYWRKINGRNTD